MALRTSKLSKNCASRGLVGPFRRAARAEKGPPGLQGGAAAPAAPPLGYVPDAYLFYPNLGVRHPLCRKSRAAVCLLPCRRWICIFFYSVYLVSYAFKSLLLGVKDLTIAVVSLLDRLVNNASRPGSLFSPKFRYPIDNTNHNPRKVATLSFTLFPSNICK